MRIAVAALLLLHGLIHLLGFLKPWKLAEVPQLSGPSSRALGLLWLAATLVLCAAAVLRLLNHDAWWVAGAVGVVLSQGLILSQWSDAKAGTVLNVLLAMAVLISFSTARFHRSNEAHARALLSKVAAQQPSTVTVEELGTLPAPVKRWLEAAGVVGKPRAHTVRLRQRGEMRTNPEGRPMHAEATQHFTIDEPGFIWAVDLTMWGVPVVGRDTFVEGRGRMFIQLGGLITVADGTGETFDQGTMLRFLGEIVWFPSAALAPYLRWEAIDDRHARATMTYKGTTTSAVFEIDAEGRVIGLAAQRYFNGKTLEQWTIPMSAWSRIRGIEMPTAGGAVWKLAAGDFDYYRWEILDVETNPGS